MHPKKAILPTFSKQTPHFLGKKQETRTNNLHHQKAGSVAVFLSLRKRAHHIQKKVKYLLQYGGRQIYTVSCKASYIHTGPKRSKQESNIFTQHASWLVETIRRNVHTEYVCVFFCPPLPVFLNDVEGRLMIKTIILKLGGWGGDVDNNDKYKEYHIGHHKEDHKDDCLVNLFLETVLLSTHFRKLSDLPNAMGNVGFLVFFFFFVTYSGLAVTSFIIH